MSALPVRYEPVREFLALGTVFPDEESVQRLLVIILHDCGADGHMVPAVVRLEIQHRVRQPVTVRAIQQFAYRPVHSRRDLVFIAHIHIPLP